MKPVIDLKGRHEGGDIWIIAAGPSTGFVDTSFFANKITIGVNRVWTRFVTDYLVVKEQNVLQAAIDSGATVIASKHHCGELEYAENKANGSFYVFEHRSNELANVDLDVIGTDEIIVSYSTITSAMHLAAYMGAANIILVGHDCGGLDGKLNFDSYPDPLCKDPGFYRHFLGQIEPQSIKVRDRLREVYGCNIYSLNPFLNFGLEGHKYVSGRESF